MFERIIAPLDGSRLSAEALAYAVNIAKRFDSEVILVRVVSKTPVGYLSQSTSIGNPGSVDIIAEQVQTKDVENAAHAKRYLANRANLLKEQGVKVTYRVIEGVPAHSIMDCAREEDASLIVMMSHGRGWFKRTILGSVTDAIMRGSKVPVLVIRPGGMKQ
jgi:nucleotide-binding universal stress UspA family protein